ncbi:MAG: SOUL family heme-binding protein [Bdellovibrionales bacterium]
MESQKVHIPLAERIKGIPGLLGIHFNESPKFKVLREEGSCELREYEPTLVAKTTVDNAGEEAKNAAFSKLAAYIFGQKASAMTTPVFEEISADGRLTMSFVLSSKLNGRSAPMPEDSSIHIQEIPSETWACLSYPGENSDQEINEHRNQLESWLILHGFSVDQRTFRVAQYDAPATIPFLRKNEVQFRIHSHGL